MALEEEQGAAKNSRIKSADNSAAQEDRTIPSRARILSSIAEIWTGLDRYIHNRYTVRNEIATILLSVGGFLCRA